ncbi:oxidoreductase [Citrobacter amalonaticus]|uniref:Oxidoreductase n=2 Tax=Citrobacter amalonaticus TaxID=35703 RepID=A0A2S4RTX6_CITAM|nr:oxidoreductase [Citrobacter amalonaticus]POT72546.1 oxidoreductase [Citrobacter amalonaticus]POU63401.1 oxidoreductase [Citrobacter amalonaticus]POV03165.1 oxidoreductase [Citrobacter amalonaticus]
MIHCAYIGFGKSATRYHLPYVLVRKDKYNVKRIYDIARKPDIEASAPYQHITFTSQLDDILSDREIQLVVICTHPDSHYQYARLCLEHGKNVLVEKPFTPTLDEAKTLFALAREKGLTVTPFQNRRFDSCFLTMKQVIESGKLGDIVEVESHFDYFRPEAETQPGSYFNGAFYGLGVHTVDQIIALLGRPQQVGYHLRQLRNPLNPDDTFDVHLYYGRVKAIVKTSHLVSIPYPRFTVHGTRGSFVRYGIDRQETSLKAGIMPGEASFGADPQMAVLEYINEAGESVREEIPPVAGDYGRVYDALYETLTTGTANYVSEREALTNLEILDKAFHQPSPAIVTLKGEVW